MPEIQSVTNRQRLGIQREPHWVRLGKGQFLGFRKMNASNGTWLARSRNSETGKQEFKALGGLQNFRDSERFFEAKKLAEAWFEHMGRGGSNKAHTIRGICEAYVSHLQDEKSENTAKDVQRRFDQYVLDDTTFAKLELSKLTETHIRNWLRKLKSEPCLSGPNKGKPRSESSLNRDITPFRAALNFAKNMRLTSSDHQWSNVLKPIKGADRRRQIVFTPEELDALIASANDDLAIFIRALCLVPLRPGAMAKLLTKDFNSTNGVLTINADKAGAGRSIALPSNTADFFKSLSKDKLPNAPLVSRSNGLAWDKDSWKNPFKSARVNAGINKPATAYALRHTAITNLIENRVSTLSVAQIAGTSIRMIESNYGHLTGRMSISALENITRFA
jgi:integrase